MDFLTEELKCIVCGTTEIFATEELMQQHVERCLEIFYSECTDPTIHLWGEQKPALLKACPSNPVDNLGLWGEGIQMQTHLDSCPSNPVDDIGLWNVGTQMQTHLNSSPLNPVNDMVLWDKGAQMQTHLNSSPLNPVADGVLWDEGAQMQTHLNSSLNPVADIGFWDEDTQMQDTGGIFSLKPTINAVNKEQGGIITGDSMSMWYPIGGFPNQESNAINFEAFPPYPTWSCEEADEIFTAEANMTQHAAVAHQQDKSWKCGQCLKAFELRTNRNKHEMNMHGGKVGLENLYQCNICDCSFAHEKFRFAHIHAVHKTRQHECFECGDKFSMKRDLIDHVRGKHVDGFACGECGQSMISRRALNQHTEIVHGGLRRCGCDDY